MTADAPDPTPQPSGPVMDIHLTERPDTSRHDMGLGIIRILILAFCVMPIVPILWIFRSPELTDNETFLVVSQLVSYGSMVLAFVLLPLLIVVGLVIRANRQKLTTRPYSVTIFILAGVLWLCYVVGVLFLTFQWFI
jgi:hypothetical protein